MDQYIGKLLDNRYEILERIGSGGMAIVYKAKCHWLNRFVAIKILKEELAKDAEFRRRFHEESQAIAMLSHPNIVAVYDVSQSPALDYIVMELIDGITLKQYMHKRGGQLSWKESLHFITQIMKGLSHAHSRGIIHRDIKPHNIMVLRDGSVKVADFGIARLTSSNNTLTREALGSVHYISPEQAKGSRIDARSDIYSAGVVLYEMITGRLPYEGDSPVAVAIQHINSVPLSPREIDSSIPAALEAITMKAMASEPDKRYVSADAMLSDLDDFRRNPNISFDYTADDLLAEEGEEPTRKLGANTPHAAVQKAGHNGRQERSEKQENGEEREADAEEEPERRSRDARDHQAKRRRKEESGKDYDYYERRRNRGNGILAVFLALLVCVGGVGMFLWVTVFSGMTAEARTYIVPKLEGRTLEEARELWDVTENGFTVLEGKYVLSETVEEGKIVSQNPDPYTEVKSGGREITVNISSGKGGLAMPEVYNTEERLAFAMLRGMGLHVTREEAPSDQITEGYVMEQRPAYGASLETGQEVTIVVSTGPDARKVSVIMLRWIPLAEAKRIVTEDLHLKVGDVRFVSSDEYPEGLVCYQSIEEGTSVPENTVINLRVSTGPEKPVSTPTPSPTPTPPPTPTPTPTLEPTPTPSMYSWPVPQPTHSYFPVPLPGTSTPAPESTATTEPEQETPVSISTPTPTPSPTPAPPAPEPSQPPSTPTPAPPAPTPVPMPVPTPVPAPPQETSAPALPQESYRHDIDIALPPGQEMIGVLVYLDAVQTSNSFTTDFA